MMSEMTSLQKDTESRNRIVSEIGTNFFVEAGAGSGKTTMLVNRMVAMVEAGIPMGKICAITFTKAAAGEFYDRFQKLLIERSNPDTLWEDKGYAGQLPKPTEESRRRCAEALKNIDLCFMGTIDSFCGMVLSEHPSEAHVPSDAFLVSDQDAKLLYKQQYVKICAGDYGTGLAEMAGRFQAFFRDAETAFAEGELLLMNNRNVKFHYPALSAKEFEEELSEEKERILRAVKCLITHPELKYEAARNPKKNLKAWEDLGEIYRKLKRPWNTNIDNVLYTLKELAHLRTIPKADELFEWELSGLFEPGDSGKWMENNIGKEGGVIEKISELQYSVSMTFLEACVPVLENFMREKSRMTYFDYLYYLRNMLRADAAGDGALINYIYKRHSYFLIDEFQDTNPMQAEVFFYLTSEHPVPKWSDCVPRQGSLFIVGDPKQSIYRFRGADVSAFLKVKRLFEKNGGQILTLSRNFRSTSVLCDYFNRSFTALLPAETADQSRFEEIPIPEPREDEFQGVFTYRSYLGSAIKDHPDETDPMMIAGIIERLVDNEDYLIRTGNDKAPRKLRYSDIMVITRTKYSLRQIMEFLDLAGIPTRVEGNVPFGSNEALIELYNLYRAISEPEDSLALCGALTGNLMGLTKEDLLLYRKDGGSISLRSPLDPETCTDPASGRVASALRDLRTRSAQARRLSPAALFASLMEDFRVYETARAENLEVVYYTLELLRNAEHSGVVISLGDGVTYLAKLIAGEAEEERCLSFNDGKDAVHMANLHKVKGLEAPVIILAAHLDYVDKAETKRIIHGEEGSDGYLFLLSKPSNKSFVREVYIRTGKFSDEVAEEGISANAEKDRLVYVAATRARNVLIIGDGIGGKTGNSPWAHLMESGLPDFFAVSGDPLLKEKPEPERKDAAELYTEAEETCVLNDRSMEQKTYSVENPSRVHLPSKLSEKQEIGPYIKFGADEEVPAEEQKTTSVSKLHEFPAVLGTMTHKLLEMLVSSGNRLDAEGAVSEIIREYITPSIKPFEKELSKALSEVAGVMRSGGYAQSNGLPQDMLQTLLTAEEVYCEVPFCYSEETEEGKVIWNGIMDVIYRKEGKWHIVDYKTNADGNDLDRRDQGQLSAYVKAFRATTGEEADAATYHIDI